MFLQLASDRMKMIDRRTRTRRCNNVVDDFYVATVLLVYGGHLLRTRNG
jgi:hypothetical protein